MRSQKKIDFAALLDRIRVQEKAGLPFVSYRNPKSHSVTALFQNDKALCYTEDFSEEGFVFSPYNSEEKAVLFNPDSQFIAEYKENLDVVLTKPVLSEKDKHHHLAIINKAIASIRAGELNKVVLSRRITTTTNKDFLTIFLNALHQYKNAFCYLWFHPKIGMWLGASPERLLNMEGKVLKTTSLAGTLPVINDEPPNWTPKELYEQQVVTDYVLDALKNDLKDVETSETSSIKAGHLWHLKTRITALLKSNTQLKDIILKIHPTPAVCGIPKNTAQDFIVENEAYNREFYTGFMGELNLGAKKGTSLFVNLRCLKIENQKAMIYVGGGITADSDAEKEWEETQNKSRTMLSLL